MTFVMQKMAAFRAKNDVGGSSRQEALYADRHSSNVSSPKRVDLMTLEEKNDDAAKRQEVLCTDKHSSNVSSPKGWRL